MAANPRYSSPCHGVSTGPSPDRLRWFHPPRYSPSTSSNEHQPATRSSLQVARRVAPAAARWRGRGSGVAWVPWPGGAPPRRAARWARVPVVRWAPALDSTAATRRPIGRVASPPGATAATRGAAGRVASPPGPAVAARWAVTCSAQRSRARAATRSLPSAHQSRAWPASRRAGSLQPGRAARRRDRVARVAQLGCSPASTSRGRRSCRPTGCPSRAAEPRTARTPTAPSTVSLAAAIRDSSPGA